jgi:hypothetical protein
MFASAYMGDRDGAKPFQRYLLRGQTNVRPTVRALGHWSESIGRMRFRPTYAGDEHGAPVPNRRNVV